MTNAPAKAYDRRTIERADHRYGEALWYAFGAEDLARDHGIDLAPLSGVDPFGFARYARNEARDYYSERVTSMDSVQGQFRRWIAQDGMNR